MNKRSTPAKVEDGIHQETIRLIAGPEEREWSPVLRKGLRVCRKGSETEKIYENSFYQIMKGEDLLGDMVVFREGECIKTWRKIPLRNPVTLGRDADQGIVVSGSRHISRKHLRISVTDRRVKADIFSMNGIYVNGRRVMQSRELSFGDRIHVFGFEMVILGEKAACSCLPFCRAAFSLPILPKPSEEEEETSGSGEREKEEVAEVFHRAPRRMEALDLSPLILKLPADIHEERTPELFGMFSSVFTMLIPMLSGTGFMMYTASMTGMGNTMFLLSGIVMTGSGAFCTVTAGLMNRMLIKRRNRKMKEEAAESFQVYLGEERRRLRGRYDQIRKVWNNRYAPPSGYLLYDRTARQLWNRNPHHEDFLLCRIGEGTLKSPLEIIVPGEPEYLGQGNFREELLSFRDEFASIAGVPVTIDLRQTDQFGFAGSENIRAEFLRALIVQLAASHSYTECRMMFFYDKAGISEPLLWDFIRWLPHVRDMEGKQRYIAWDRESGRMLLKSVGRIIRERAGRGRAGGEEKQQLPHYILFVINASYIEEDPLYRIISGGIGHLGMTAIWAADTPDLLPNVCRHVIYKDEREQGMYDLSAKGDGWQQIALDQAGLAETDRFARCLGGIRLARAGPDRSIPEIVTFFDLYRISKADELAVEERWEKNHGSKSLEAVIGLREGGRPCFLDISEKSHGPHGLIAGTTGSGKSEILQTYILSLSLNYSPGDVSFFIIDYKGGGMSELFADLPHVCGRISNLSSGLVMRAMTSIQSENRRRQKLFLEQKVNHIDAYRQKYDAGQAKEPLGHLLIIIDEFAELKKEEPAFMAELISVAQVGRSLGVHLILATQKPGGTVDDKIWSNSRFRICLRVQDEQDSIDMLHSKDAAGIINTGRGIMQVGSNEIYEYFQGGWSGAPCSGEDEKNTVGLVSPDGSMEVYRERRKEPDHEKGQSQLESVRDLIRKSFFKSGLPLPGSLWMEPLPGKVYMEDLRDMNSGNEPEVTVGLFDDPENQCRSAFSLRLPDCGHTMVVGMPVSGKSVFVQTFLFGLFAGTEPEECRAYLIDCSAGSMKAFSAMPHVRACCGLNEGEAYERVFSELTEEADRRRKAFAGGNFRQYRASGKGDYPLLWLIIDDMGTFRAGTEYRYDSILERLCREGESSGILLLFTALDTGVSQIPAALRDGCRTRVCLAMKDAFSQSDVFGILHLPVIPEAGIEGRGLAKQDGRILEFQTALCLHEDNDYERYKKICALSAKRRSACPDGAFSGIYVPPETMKVNEMARMIDEDCHGRVPVGLRFEDGSPVLLSPESCCFLVVWNEEVWMKRSLNYLAEAIRLTGGSLKIMIDLREEYSHLSDCFRILTGEDAVFETFRDLIPEIQKRAAGRDREKIIYILIPHLADLLGIMQTGKYDMKGFFNNVWEKGKGLGICFAGWVSSLEDISLSGTEAYEVFSSHERGIRQDSEGRCYMKGKEDDRIIIPEIEI